MAEQERKGNEKQACLTINGRAICAEIGTTVSEAIHGERPCGGHGRCGKCKVKVRGALTPIDEAEAALLSFAELEAGIRLGCRARVLGDCAVELPNGSDGAEIVTEGDLPAFSLNPAFSSYGVAVDIGTTTLAARLYGADGVLLSETACLNPQREWGADVISRVEAALGGKAKELARATREALDEIVRTLTGAAGIESRAVDGLVLTGNTVMLSLLAEADVSPFACAPFAAKRLFGETTTAGALGLASLMPDTHVYLAPCISAFVGADTTCALLATELCKNKTAMLLDIGTNGEMALWQDGCLTVASTAAGPAFEGVGISAGMRSEAGAIDRVTVERGRLSAHVIGEGIPVGICGSGLVDAVAGLLRLEILDETGYLCHAPFPIARPVFLTQEDVRMLQLAKSAICAGVRTLLAERNLTCEDVPVLYVAGGFGKHLDRENAAKIGLLPEGLAVRAGTVGNAALGGACILLLNREAREPAETIAKSAKTIALSASTAFSKAFMAGMLLKPV